MKWKAIALTALLTALSAGVASADDQAKTASPPPPAKSGNVCLWTYNIDHTTVKDPQTILFHMRDGKIWKNSLQNRCNGLMFHGFVYVVRADQVCGNMQSIRVIEDGNVCMLGPFTPYTEPPKKKQASNAK